MHLADCSKQTASSAVLAETGKGNYASLANPFSVTLNRVKGLIQTQILHCIQYDGSHTSFGRLLRPLSSQRQRKESGAVSRQPLSGHSEERSDVAISIIKTIEILTPAYGRLRMTGKICISQRRKRTCRMTPDPL